MRVLVFFLVLFSSCLPDGGVRYLCEDGQAGRPAEGEVFGCGHAVGAFRCPDGCLVSAWDGSDDTEFGDGVLRYELRLRESIVYRWRRVPARRESL